MSDFDITKKMAELKDSPANKALREARAKEMLEEAIAEVRQQNLVASLRQQLADTQRKLEAAEKDAGNLFASLKDVVGEHHAPNDCYSTGPMTGNHR